MSENIKDLIHVDRTELYKKSIFSLLHESDHTKLKPLLRNSQALVWDSGNIDKFQATQVRLIKSTNANDVTGYVLMSIYRTFAVTCEM